MRTLRKSYLLIVFCLLLSTTGVLAEIIILENDTVIQGKITQYGKDSLTLETPAGVEDIPISKIRLIDYLSTAKKYQQLDSGVNKFILYLKNGEIVEGVITQFTNEFLTIDSPKGYGVLQIPISSVNFITSERSHIDLNQRDGIGYSQKRSTLNASSGLSTYSSNQISYKFFIDKEVFGNILLAYGTASYGGDKLQVLSLDYRMGMIFKRMQNIVLYYGGSVGYLQIDDDSKDIEGSGTGFGAFAGAEIFFQSLPNFGFAGEIGVGMQKAGDYEATDLSISSFPSFSIHYYF